MSTGGARAFVREVALDRTRSAPHPRTVAALACDVLRSRHLGGTEGERSERSERHHNRALAWLLSPDADHGVGRAVLLAIARGIECKVLEEDLADPRSNITVRGYN